MMRSRRGFTLIEVIIALFVVALGIGALLTTLVSSADSLGRLRDKSMAEWIALNHISEVRLSRRTPATGITSGKVDDYGGRPWTWQQTVSDPGIAGMLRIDVSVALAEGSDTAAPAAAATPGESGQDTFRGIATAYGFYGTAVGQATGNNPEWSSTGANPPGSPDDGKPEPGKPGVAK
jgi:general secretion pathway protein I